MKKLLYVYATSLALVACGGGESGVSAEDFAKSLCSARENVYKAKSEEEFNAAKADMDKLEKQLEENTDEEFTKKVRELDMNCKPE